MRKIKWEKERKDLDRLITFFHFKKAMIKINRCLKMARKENNKFYYLYFHAQKEMLKENFSQAIEFLNMALEIKEDPLSYNDKAICLAELGRYKSAMKVFNQGINRIKDNATLYHNKGWLLNKLGKYKEAIVLFNKALELEKDRVESIYSIGDSYLKLGKREEAYRYLKKALILIKGKSKYIRQHIEKRLKTLEKENRLFHK